MKYNILGKTGLSVSKVSLGTAEIGFSYGLGERSLPTEEEAINLLHKAVDLGINFFDTANYYGLSEERIGKSKILKKENIFFETKCAKFLEDNVELPEHEQEKLIRSQVESSLKNLQVDVIPVLLLHGPSAKQIESGFLISLLGQLKKEGKIMFSGVSTRGEEAPLAAIFSNFFDVIQVAYSILDQRMSARVIPEALKNGVGVVARSVLLKGVLTDLRSNLPDHLSKLNLQVEELEEVAASLGISVPELAIKFALANSGIDTILIGTNKVEHVSSAVAISGGGELSAEVLGNLSKYKIDDIMLVDPSKWSVK